MQLVALTSVALFAATSLASASPNVIKESLQQLNDKCNTKNPMVKIVNTCSEKVWFWSVSKGDTCGPGGHSMEPGEFYQENYRPAAGKTAVSIKLSWSDVCDCKTTDITQVEYMIETSGSKRDGVLGNFHDISFVDCNTYGGNCPGRDGFYLKTGNFDGKFMSSDNNEHCPILECNDKKSCASMAYINPDDVQTKWCQAQANMEFHICGKNGSAPAPSSQAAAPSKAAPSSQAPAYTPLPSSVQAYTPPPVVTPSPPSAPSNTHIKTEYVYTTVVVEVEAKRDHVKRHAHRHQHFHA